MLFDDMSFSEANESLTGADAFSIGLSAGTGAMSGLGKFATWIKSPTGQKIFVKMLEMGISSLEDMLKQYVKDGDVDLKQTLTATLTELGMGHLLKNNKVLKEIEKQDKIISKAEGNIAKIKNGTGTVNGKMKRMKQYEVQKSKVGQNKQFWENVDKVFNKTKEKAGSTYSTGVYEKNIKEKKKK